MQRGRRTRRVDCRAPFFFLPLLLLPLLQLLLLLLLPLPLLQPPPLLLPLSSFVLPSFARLPPPAFFFLAFLPPRGLIRRFFAFRPKKIRVALSRALTSPAIFAGDLE